MPSTPPSALLAQRLSLTEWQAENAAASPPLGGLGYGLASDATQALGGLGVKVLSAAGPQIDAWFSAAPALAGRCGGVHWRHDGHWLHGVIDLDEQSGAEAGELEALARAAYLDVFATLRQTGCPHLLRVWNYLPAINVQRGGLERYRQFNIGRQRAFIETGHDAFEGSPAACAIGTHAGRLSVRFLAGWTPPQPVENPRQVPAYRYPSQFGPRSPTFSRAALVEFSPDQLAFLVSGTASIVGHESLHAGDVAEQTRETVRNLRALISAAHQHGSARFELADLETTVYVRHPQQLAAITQVWESEVGATSRAAVGAVYVEADICRQELLVEIEGQMVAPGRLAR